MLAVAEQAGLGLPAAKVPVFRSLLVVVFIA